MLMDRCVPYQKKKSQHKILSVKNFVTGKIIRLFLPTNLFAWLSENIKGATTDMRYFARSKFSRSLVHRKKLSLIRQVVLKLGYVFCQERQDTSFEFE